MFIFISPSRRGFFPASASVRIESDGWEKKTCGREIDVRAQPTLVIQFTSLQLAFGVLQQLLVRRQIGFKVKFDERFFSLDEEKKTFRRNIC